LIIITIRGHRLPDGTSGAENTLSGHADTPGLRGPRRSFGDFALSSFASKETKKGGPPPIEGIGGGPSPA
jgi:hypothetical protein